MTENIEKAARALVAKFLPYTLKRTLRSYYHFVKNMPVDLPLESKEFKEHQAAGKMAMAHIESHLKVAALAGGPSGKPALATADLQDILNDPDIQAADAIEDGFEDEQEVV